MFKSLIILYKIVYVNRFAKKTVERSVLGNILLCIKINGHTSSEEGAV